MPVQTVIRLKQGSSDEIKLEYNILRKAVIILRSVNHRLRQNMIKLLDENERMTVTDIYVRMRLEQSVASQHLAILRKAGAVTTVREGKNIFYMLKKERLEEIGNMINAITE